MLSGRESFDRCCGFAMGRSPRRRASPRVLVRPPSRPCRDRAPSCRNVDHGRWRQRDTAGLSRAGALDAGGVRAGGGCGSVTGRGDPARCGKTPARKESPRISPGLSYHLAHTAAGAEPPKRLNQPATEYFVGGRDLTGWSRVGGWFVAVILHLSRYVSANTVLVVTSAIGVGLVTLLT